MLSIVAVALEFASMAPKLIEAGVNIYSMWTKIRAALDDNKAPGNPEWDAADKAVNALMDRVMDPATDNR